MPRFEFVQGTSSKFWQIELDGNVTTVTFGKIGSAGQSKPKEHADAAKAAKFYDSQIASKTKEGYVAVGDDAKRAAGGKSGVVGVVTLADNAAFPRFELNQLAFRLGSDKKTFTFEFDSDTPVSKAPTKKKKRRDEDDDDDDDENDEEDDWCSKAAWENYGPNFSCDASFGSLIAAKEVDLNKLPQTLSLADVDEPLNIHCCDHQSSKDHVLKLVSSDGDKFEIEWRGKIIMDGDDDNAHEFFIKGTATRQL
jgi:predicted DNA-binding WGR domain protein